jgi:lipopolysaccharide export system protein LptC
LIRRVRKAWDMVSIYLPILLMGVLALGTYWLVRSTPELTLPSVVKPVKHQPDYFMRQFSVKTFDEAGRLRSEIFGDEARHYPDTDTLEIDKVRIRSFNTKGQLTTATANSALTNSNASEVQLIGNAQIVKEPVVNRSGETSPRMTYRSEFLHAFMDTEVVKSNKPVELTRGKDQFTADKMEFDNIEQVMQLEGRVKGVLVPSTARQN